MSDKEIRVTTETEGDDVSQRKNTTPMLTITDEDGFERASDGAFDDKEENFATPIRHDSSPFARAKHSRNKHSR